MNINIQNTHVPDLHKILSEFIGKEIPRSVVFSPQKVDAIMKKIEHGSLRLSQMDKDMKITHTKWYQCNIEHHEILIDVLVQIAPDKFAIYFLK